MASTLSSDSTSPERLLYRGLQNFKADSFFYSSVHSGHKTAKIGLLWTSMESSQGAEWLISVLQGHQNLQEPSKTIIMPPLKNLSSLKKQFVGPCDPCCDYISRDLAAKDRVDSAPRSGFTLLEFANSVLLHLPGRRGILLQPHHSTNSSLLTLWYLCARIDILP